MKINKYLIIQRALAVSALALFGALASSHAQAATIAGGALTLNIDRDALIANIILDNTAAPSIYLEEFWDATAASKTFAQLRDINTPINITDYAANEISAAGLQFAINGSTIPANPVGRQNKATNFSFDPTDLTGTANGQIGLGGVMRFRVDVTPPSNRVLLGDMALEYDPTLVDAVTGRSGWVLMNYIGFPISGFDLFDVTTLLTANNLTLNGNIGLGHGFAHLGGITDSKVGTFSFQTSVIPVPAAVWLFGSGLAGLGAAGYRNKKRIS